VQSDEIWNHWIRGMEGYLNVAHRWAGEGGRPTECQAPRIQALASKLATLAQVARGLASPSDLGPFFNRKG
jgi:hypothetical protein